MTVTRIAGVLAIIAAVAGAAFSAFYLWFFRMMRGWSHVRSPDDWQVEAVLAAAFLVSVVIGYGGYRLFKRKK